MAFSKVGTLPMPKTMFGDGAPTYKNGGEREGTLYIDTATGDVWRRNNFDVSRLTCDDDKLMLDGETVATKVKWGGGGSGANEFLTYDPSTQNSYWELTEPYAMTAEPETKLWLCCEDELWGFKISLSDTPKRFGDETYTFDVDHNPALGTMYGIRCWRYSGAPGTYDFDIERIYFTSASGGMEHPVCAFTSGYEDMLALGVYGFHAVTGPLGPVGWDLTYSSADVMPNVVTAISPIDYGDGTWADRHLDNGYTPRPIGAADVMKARPVNIGWHATDIGASDGGTVVIGSEATVSSDGVAVGRKATARYQGTAIGDTASAGSGSAYPGAVAIGLNSNASRDSIAVGHASHAETSAVAIGQNTMSSNGAVAIGNGSQATTKDECSFGTDDAKRRLTHVAAPTGPDDAATKSYVDALAGTPVYAVASDTDTTSLDGHTVTAPCLLAVVDGGSVTLSYKS